MLYVDLEQFWKDDALAHKENCFAPASPQVALGLRMSEECVYAELGEEGAPWLEAPRERRIELNKRYNDKAERIVGRRLLPESLPESDSILPQIRGIHEIFGGRYIVSGESNWLTQSCGTPRELEAVLDAADGRIRNLREFILPENWEAEKQRIYETHGVRPQPFRQIRGPVTLAMSLYGVENLIYLLVDAPELAERFSRTISDALFGMATIMDAEAGYGRDNRPGGFSFNDDECCMLTPDMYETFAFPILKRMFEHWSPNPEDVRFQHSDSPMGHLLPVLARLDFTGCNFGPTLTVREIRAHMPRTRIDGQLAPFTFMGNDERAIVAEVKRDCEMARPERGLNLSTAGSINNGSLLTSMRAVMHAIQTYGRY
jgi:uroporphyrinogen decarboxylase